MALVAISSVTSTQLLSILSDINNKLPPGISLPLKLSNDHLLTFYKHFHTLVVPLDTQFHIVIALPLTMSNYQFTLYNVISMPYTPPDLNVSVQYSLEHTQIAISANKEHYAPVSDSESLHCQQTPICALRSPILRVRTYPTCILALFLRNDTMIKNMCKTRIYPALSLPSVKYLAFGHWIISTSTQFNLQIS